MSSRSSRGVAPVVGVVVLVAVTVLLAAVVGAFAIGLGSGADDTPQAAITARSGDNPNEIFLTHRGGDTLAVDGLTIRIFVDGQPLDHQPEVPFFGESGFVHGATGPFNPNNDQHWSAGESARLEIAHTTNSPQPTAGSTVTVRIYVDDEIVATAKT